MSEAIARVYKFSEICKLNFIVAWKAVMEKGLKTGRIELNFETVHQINKKLSTQSVLLMCPALKTKLMRETEKLKLNYCCTKDNLGKAEAKKSSFEIK